MNKTLLALPLCAVWLTGAAAYAQDPPPQQDPQTQDATGGGRGGRAADPVIKPYDRVITKDATSKTGVFAVHRIKDRLFYEIPKEVLGREFLWVSQIKSTTLGAGYGGQAAGNRVVRWERRGDRVFLRSVSYEITADAKTPIARAVRDANFDPIVMSFNIEALGKNDAPVIEVTRLFTTDVPEFSGRTRVRARTFDQSRSFVDRAAAFPENIEIESIQTYNNPPDDGGGRGGAPVPAPGGGRGAAPVRPGSASVVMHYSMVLLPGKPMQPRFFDERVGYFSTGTIDYGQDEHKSPDRRFITRYRLEKKDPNAALSEPVKPIIYWVDPATPTKWIPYVKKGTTTENAVGPHIHDPRSGEILEADVQFYHNVMNLARDWYFIQAGPLDARAKTLPLPDDLMGRLIEYVVAHEVGHTLGFQHNMKASSMYPAAKIRDAQFLKANGHTPTLMDYSRFNYVVQPEDKIDPADLVPKIGPYDKWATMWGYKPIPAAKSADEEKKTLDEWAREQDTKPYLRFSTANSRGADPGELTEAVGDDDAVASTTLGLKNLERVANMLLPATTTKPGEDFGDLEELYGRVLGQWSTELSHVAAIVGGFNSQTKNVGQDGVRFTSIGRDRQQRAVQFLNANAFKTPAFLIKPEILRRIEPSGILDRIETGQRRVLNSLLSTARVNRLVEQETLDGASAYPATDFLADVRKGVWGEVYGDGPVTVDAYRRNLHRAYIETLAERVNGRAATADDARAFFRGELKTLDADLKTALARTSDRATKLHLEDIQNQIAHALDPAIQGAAGAAAGGRVGTSLDEFDVAVPPDACWLDYTIRPRRAGGGQ